jgi:hypothetical protein
VCQGIVIYLWLQNCYMKTKVYRNGMVHVLAKQCDTCIFRRGNKMDLREGRVEGMVKECLKKDSYVICHETMDDKRKHAVCKGFFVRYWRDVVPLRMARAFNKVWFMKLPE